MDEIRYYLSKWWVKSLILFVISAVVMVLLGTLLQPASVLSFCDASFVVGAILLGMGLMSFVTFYGVFDIFGYSTSYVFNGMKKGSNQRYKDFHDYIEQKTERRKKNRLNFIPYVALGLGYILVAIILYVFI